MAAVQMESSLACRDHEAHECERCDGTGIEPCSACGEPTSAVVESDGETYCQRCHDMEQERLAAGPSDAACMGGQSESDMWASRAAARALK